MKIGKVIERSLPVVEYKLDWPDGVKGDTHEFVFDPTNNDLWVTGETHDAIAKLSFRDGMEKPRISYYAMPQGSRPHGIAFDYLNNLWITLEGGGLIVRVNKHGKIVEKINVRFNGKNPGAHGLTASLDGKELWFTGKFGSTIGKINLRNRSLKQIKTPTKNSQPIYITPDFEGNFWFTELLGNNIGRITPKLKITEYAIPTKNSRPIEITASKDKKYLWFSEESGKKLGKISINGHITEFPVPITQNNIILDGSTIDSESNVWVGSYIDPKNLNKSNGGYGYVIKFNKKINKVNDGNITNIPITYYKVPTRNAVLHRLREGPDKNMWFTELSSDKIGKIILDKDDI